MPRWDRARHFDAKLDQQRKEEEARQASGQLALEEIPDSEAQLLASLLENKIPSARRDGEDTEHGAAEKAAPYTGNARAFVLLALYLRGERGGTDYELGAMTGMLRTSAGKRRLELEELGLCFKTERRRRTDTTANAIVHQVNSQGARIAEKIQDQLGVSVAEILRPAPEVATT